MRAPATCLPDSPSAHHPPTTAEDQPASGSHPADECPGPCVKGANMYTWHGSDVLQAIVRDLETRLAHGAMQQQAEGVAAETLRAELQSTKQDLQVQACLGAAADTSCSSWPAADSQTSGWLPACSCEQQTGLPPPRPMLTAWHLTSTVLRAERCPAGPAVAASCCKPAGAAGCQGGCSGCLSC